MFKIVLDKVEKSENSNELKVARDQKDQSPQPGFDQKPYTVPNK